VALPKGCVPFDLLKDPLWSDVPYMKGAFFYKAVAEVLGVDGLDRVLADFYRKHVGHAAKMADMIAALASAAKDDAGRAKIESLAILWLETKDCPIDTSKTPACP
jgi:aminopeptidase N